MGPYKGDFTTSDTVYFLFDTFSSDDPSASITMTGLATSDIEVYKNGSTTQRASDAGYTLLDTDGIDFDSITGVHGISIDLSDNTDAGFYTSGGEFDVVIASITVDGATVNFHVGSFSIDRIPRVNVHQISDDATAAINAEAFFDGTGYAGTNNVIPTVTTLTGHTAQTGDSFARLGAPAGASVSADIAENQTDLDTIIADTNELQGDWTNGGRLDLILDELTTQGDTNETKIDTIDTNVDAILVDTGTTLPGVLGTPAGADLATDIAANQTDLDAILADTNELQGDWTNGGRLDLIIDAILADTNELQSDDVPGLIAALNDPTAAAIRAEIDSNSTQLAAIVADTNELQTDDVPGLIAALNDLSTADVNAQVVDALATDTYAEPTGVPGATVTLAAKIGYLYMALRNQVTVTSTKKTFFDDSGTAEWEKDLSDDGTTYTETEANAI